MTPAGALAVLAAAVIRAAEVGAVEGRRPMTDAEARLLRAAERVLED